MRSLTTFDMECVTLSSLSPRTCSLRTQKTLVTETMTSLIIGIVVRCAAFGVKCRILTGRMMQGANRTVTLLSDSNR